MSDASQPCAGVEGLTVQCRELWRKEAAVGQSIQAMKEELHKWEKGLRSTMSKVRMLAFTIAFLPPLILMFLL